ncbi:MAG TPA: 50S ribosomal protein L3 [Acidobacteriota bacterium]|nr:50S ribosomal protein L3 [Acidobacteriota bacterium]
MRQLLGKKRGMTRLFKESGNCEAVTVIELGPCSVVQVKSSERDGYDALQLGFGDIRPKLVNRALKGHFKSSEPRRYLREIRLNGPAQHSVGDVLTVDIFKPGERIDVVGTSKGLGFQGGVRRHGFAGGPKTHGQSDRLRAPGSIGAGSSPSRTFRGHRMAGRMGNERVTVRNLTVVDVLPEENLIFVRGAVPGKRNAFVVVRETGTR